VIPVEVAADGAALAELAAARMAMWVRDDLAAAGRCAIGLSGGSTPAPMIDALAQESLAWSAVSVFQVDERVVPPDDPERNARLLEPLRVAGAIVHPMPVDGEPLDEAASAYASLLVETCGGVLDAVQLGIGEDGHTASWPPDDAVVHVGDDGPLVAVVGPFNGYLRMTLTPPVIDRARRVMWLVAGSGKAEVLARLLAGDRTIPATRVPRERALVLAEEAAAGGASAAH
jgi:6-phosphogluconolactonase